jgi:hypothetical protein
VGSVSLQVIDVSNPESPTPIGEYDTPGIARGIFVSGNYAYVADDTFGLQIFDISNPASPTLVGNYDTPGIAWDVAVSDHYAYVADDTTGIQVIDVSNPEEPALAGNCDTPGNARGIVVSGHYAHVADLSAGLQIVDISNPGSPVPAVNYDTPGDAFGVFVAEGFAYVAEHFSLMILRLPQFVDVSEEKVLPRRFLLGQNYPNPFNPVTTIEYSLARRSYVTIDVYNILGRWVRKLVDRDESAGSYTITWDGRSESGQSVSTGVYLYRFQAGEHLQTKKMVLLK